MNAKGISTRLLDNITKHSDFALAFLVVMIISLMIIPIPKVFLDVLLAANISIAVILLMLSLYIPNTISLCTFPSILLVTTLFRLSLNVTTTRMILLDAEAGSIIITFGNFVAKGNFIVGVVIFLIILIVQFMVITKGAERVAEVAARFTLDAMPGKQMSIDADLRSGLLNTDQGKQKRKELQTESQLYGALDGAMKFVKGDAMAGLIITAINIIAGIIIGITQKGMSPMEAVQTFSILTIGDGLVSQIPALLISITAGIVVTRVTDPGADEDAPQALGKDIIVQFLRHYKPIIIGGCLVSLLSIVPGFPTLIFLSIGVALTVLGVLLMKFPPLGLQMNESKKGSSSLQIGNTVLQITVCPKFFINEEEIEEIAEKVNIIQLGHLGLPLTNVVVELDNKLGEGEFQFKINGDLIFKEVILNTKILVDVANTSGLILGDEALQTITLDSRKHYWIDESHISKLKELDLAFIEPIAAFELILTKAFKKNTHDFLSVEETKTLLKNAGEQHTTLAMEVQQIIKLATITEVFRRLVEEQIPLKNMRVILEVLNEKGVSEQDPVILTDYVRVGLKRTITNRYCHSNDSLYGYLLSREIENSVRSSITHSTAGSFLSLDPKISEEITRKIIEEVGFDKDPKKTSILITEIDIRRYIRNLLKNSVPNLTILCHQEIDAAMTIYPLGIIST